MKIKDVKNILAKVKRAKKEPKLGKQNVGMRLNGYGIFELVKPSPTAPPTFVVQTKKKPLQFTNEVEGSRFLYKPYSKVPWSLCEEPTDYGNQEALWKQVQQAIYEHIDLPNPSSYTVLTAWVFASWLLEKWQIAPYLFFYGSFATGKTRMLEILSKLCFRGWLSLYCTPATLYRPIENWKPTLFLDEAEMYGQMTDVLGLLNGSYRRGQYVARQVEVAGSYETAFFDCFSFKAIAGTKGLAKTLQSRCIVFRTSQATRKINFFINEKQCLELRNKLLKWRFDTLLSELSDCSEGVWKRGEELVEMIGSQREVELFYPLLSIVSNKRIEDELIEYAKTTSKKRIQELSLSPEVVCLSAIIEAQRQHLIQSGRVYLRDITTIINEGLPLNEQWSNRFIGSLCSRLGFQKVRAGSGGRSAIVWDQQLIKRLEQDNRYKSCFIPSSNAQNNQKAQKPQIEKWESLKETNKLG